MEPIAELGRNYQQLAVVEKHVSSPHLLLLLRFTNRVYWRII